MAVIKTDRVAVLLSGGIDSIALMYWKRPDIAITIDYGQAAANAEVNASKVVTATLGIDHRVIEIDCRSIGSGDLLNTPASAIAPTSDWWPYRNQLLVTIAAAALVSENVRTLLLGTVRSDSSHRDGSPEFVRALSDLLQLQEGSLRVESPAIAMSSAELVRASRIPWSTLAWAHSCHTAEFACGTCRGCHKHFQTTRELGVGPY